MRRLICSLACLGVVACARDHAPVARPPLLAAPARADAPKAPQGGESVALGPVTFDVAIAETAQVFYVVDQLSLWSPHSHPQYAQWANEGHLVLGERERAALEAHRRIRSASRGWGALDRAFASTSSIGEAATHAVDSGTLTPQEANEERAVLETLEPLLSRAIADGQPRLQVFRDLVKQRASAVGRVLADLQAFAETYTPLPIPLFLVFDPVPHTGGGGYNGGVAWVEVNDTASAMGTLIHEAIHVVMHDRFGDIARSAASCGSGLDAETLNEGLDYAVSPGMLHEDNGDPLYDALDDARRRGTPA